MRYVILVSGVSCYLSKLYLNRNHFTNKDIHIDKNLWKILSLFYLFFKKKKQRVRGELSFNLGLPLVSAIYFQNDKGNGRNLYPFRLFSTRPIIIWLVPRPQPKTAFSSQQITPSWQTEWVLSQPHLTGPPRIMT